MKYFYLGVSLVFLIASTIASAANRGDQCATSLVPLISFQWPHGNELADHEALVKAVKRDLKRVFIFKQREITNDLIWRGPLLPAFLRYANLDFHERVTLKYLKHVKEDQGRDPLSEMISILIQTGMDQGRRILAYSEGYNSALLNLHSLKAQILTYKNSDDEDDLKYAESTSEAIFWNLKSISDGTTTKNIYFSHMIPDRAEGFPNWNWPLHYKPAIPNWILEAISFLISQAYTVSPKESDYDIDPSNFNSIILSRLPIGFNLGIEQGRRHFVSGPTSDLQKLITRVRILQMNIQNLNRRSVNQILREIDSILKAANAVRS